MSKKLTNNQIRFIKRNYQNFSVDEICQRLRIKPGQVQQIIDDLSLKTKTSGIVFKKSDSFLDRYSIPMLALFTLVYVAFFFFICALRYHVFNYSDFDLAVHAQTVYNILHGSIQSSILGIPFLGNHLSLILFLIAPIYAIFSTPLTLLFFQTLLIGLGAVPLFLLAKEVLDKKFAFLFSVLYLLFPALTNISQYEFHPVAFTIFFLLFMFYFFEKSRFIPFVCFMVLSLLCKENMALGIFFFGLYVIFFRKKSWKWSVVPIVLSLLWLIIGIKVLHSFNQGTIDFNYIYSHIGKSIPEVVVNLFIHPGVTLRYIFDQGNMKLLIQLFLPLGFLCLLSPKTLFIALPFFLQQMLSIRAEDHTIDYHYAAKLIPFLFIAAVYGARTVLKSKFLNRHKIILVAFLIVSCIVSNIFFGLLTKIPGNFSTRYKMKDISYYKQEFIEKIPQGASVVATFEFLPKLSQRKEIHSFHHVYIGTYTLSKKKYVLPEDIDYALLDFDDYLTFTDFHLPQHYKRLQDFFAGNKWGLIAIADNVGLFKRAEKTDLKLYQILDEATSLSSVRFNIEDNIIGLGYNIAKDSVKAGDVVPLSFVWQCNRETKKDYWISFKLEDKEGNILHQYNHPICYRIYPTFGWKKGDIIRENVWLIVPQKLKIKEARIKMLVFDRGTAGLKGGIAKGSAVKSNMYGIFDSGGWINLGSIEIDSN